MRLGTMIGALVAAALLLPATSALADLDRTQGDPGVYGDERTGAQQQRDRMQPQQPAQRDQQMQQQRDRGDLAKRQGDAEHVVQKGDTLAEIAQEKLGSADKWREIARANDIDDPKQLRVGQRLQIPNGEGDQGSTGRESDRMQQQERERTSPRPGGF